MVAVVAKRQDLPPLCHLEVLLLAQLPLPPPLPLLLLFALGALSAADQAAAALAGSQDELLKNNLVLIWGAPLLNLATWESLVLHGV